MNFCYLYDICCFICMLFSLVAGLTEIKHDLAMIVVVSWCWAWLPVVKSNTISYGPSPVCIGNQTSVVSPLGIGSGWPGLGLCSEPSSRRISNMNALECSKQAIALDTRETRLPGGLHLDKRLTRALLTDSIIHDNLTNRTTLVLEMHHSNFYPINFRW